MEIAENNQGILSSGCLHFVTERAGAAYDLNNRFTAPEEGEVLDQEVNESNSYRSSINVDYTLLDGLGRFHNFKSLKERYNQARGNHREYHATTAKCLLGNCPAY